MPKDDDVNSANGAQKKKGYSKWKVIKQRQKERKEKKKKQKIQKKIAKRIREKKRRKERKKEKKKQQKKNKKINKMKEEMRGIADFSENLLDSLFAKPKKLKSEPNSRNNSNRKKMIRERKKAVPKLDPLFPDNGDFCREFAHKNKCRFMRTFGDCRKSHKCYLCNGDHSGSLCPDRTDKSKEDDQMETDTSQTKSDNKSKLKNESNTTKKDTVNGNMSVSNNTNIKTEKESSVDRYLHDVSR